MFILRYMLGNHIRENFGMKNRFRFMLAGLVMFGLSTSVAQACKNDEDCEDGFACSFDTTLPTDTGSCVISAVPEPSAFYLVGLGLAGIAGVTIVRRRKRSCV